MPVTTLYSDFSHSKCIKVIPGSEWNAPLAPEMHAAAQQALELGQVLFYPELRMTLSQQELGLLSPAILAAGFKNISYQARQQTLRGVQGDAIIQQQVKVLMHRYADYAKSLITQQFPQYAEAMQIGRTSLRTVEVEQRVSSYRKDDTRLHVDAFPSSPNQGKRILRVFCNINPAGRPRVWRLGEPFFQVAARFIPQIPAPIVGSAWCLKTFKITKTRRSAYDHYMLQIHDRMKGDMAYQNQVQAEEVHLPANSTWVVFTDQVSHAALAGQHMLEQTFYLPVEAMAEPLHSPLKVLEQLKAKRLA